MKLAICWKDLAGTNAVAYLSFLSATKQNVWWHEYQFGFLAAGLDDSGKRLEDILTSDGGFAAINNLYQVISWGHIYNTSFSALLQMGPINLSVTLCYVKRACLAGTNAATYSALGKLQCFVVPLRLTVVFQTYEISYFFRAMK